MKSGDIYKTNGGCDIKIIENNGWDKVIVEFQDEHKYRVTTSRSHAENGGIKNPYHPNFYSVGYMGVGEHGSFDENRDRKINKTWVGMLERCYCPKYQAKVPTYIGCSVADEWHNYQNFADWYTNHEFYGRGYHLDKDILFFGNKVYSPETCTLVPREVNAVAVIKGNNSEIGRTGVQRGLLNQRYRARIRVDGKVKNLGLFDTEVEAHNAFVMAKSDNIVRVANENVGNIDSRTFDALIVLASKVRSGECYV